jgi:hypothetical protein
LVIDVLARTGEDADHPAAKVRIGIDSGKALAVNNGRRGHREPLFLGEPANQAAKRASGGEATGIYLTNNRFEPTQGYSGPAPVVAEHEGVMVVRDDLFPGGTIARQLGKRTTIFVARRAKPHRRDSFPRIPVRGYGVLSSRQFSFFLLGDDPVHGSLSGWIAEW